MSQNDTDVMDNLLFCATLIKGLEISMNAQRIFSLIAATLLTTPVWAENTAAGLSTTDDYVNATGDRAAESKSGERFFGDRLKINGTIRARVDSGDTAANYASQDNAKSNSVSHLNADLWFSARLVKDWRVVTQIEPQIDLETGKFNGDHDIPMNKLFLEGTIYDKVKTRLGRFGAFSSYGRVLDNEVTGGELFFDYAIPTKVTVARVTKHLNDNPWGVEVRREPLVAVQSVFPINDNVKIGATVAGLKDVVRQNKQRKDALFGEIGVDAKFADKWYWMAAYSRSNINDTRDSSDKKVSQDGVFTGVRFNQSDWKTRNSYDVFFNLRRVGAMSGISSVEDYSKNVQGAQIGFNYVPYKNLKFNAFYLHGKQINTTVGKRKQDVNVVRAQLEYTF